MKNLRVIFYKRQIEVDNPISLHKSVLYRKSERDVPTRETKHVSTDKRQQEKL